MSLNPVRAAVLNAIALEGAPPDSMPPPSTFREKWDEIAASQDLKPGTQAFSAWTQQRTEAGHQRLHELFFQGRSELEGFKAICERIGIKTPPTTVAGCRQAIKDNLINIYDLIDAVERENNVLVWPIEQWDDFKKYTLNPKNCYNLQVAKDSEILCCFLQRLRGGKSNQRGGPFTLRGLSRVYLRPKPTIGKPRIHPRSRIIRGPLVAYPPPTPTHSDVKKEEVDKEESQDDYEEYDDDDDDDDKIAAEDGTFNKTIFILDPDPSDTKGNHSGSPSGQEADEPSCIDPSPPPSPMEEPRKKRPRSPAPEWVLPAPNPKRMTIWNMPSTPTQDFTLRPPPPATTTTTVVADNEASVCSKGGFRTHTSLRRTPVGHSLSSPAVSSSLRTVTSFVVDPDDEDQPPPPSAQPF